MAKIPHFAGKQSLSLTDLQALADAIPQPVHGFTALPAARGRVQYGLAQYHADECAGVVAEPDTPGLICGVEYVDGVEEPHIVNGAILLPKAQAGGGITSCSFSSPITEPTVRNNQLLLPYAEQTNEICLGKATPVYTPGVLKHVSFAPDNCNACGYYPWIADGACYVPTPIVALGGEDGKNALCNHLIDCEYAPITLSSCKLPDGTMLYLQGWTERNGQQLRLKLTTDNAYYY